MQTCPVLQIMDNKHENWLRFFLLHIVSNCRDKKQNQKSKLNRNNKGWNCICATDVWTCPCLWTQHKQQQKVKLFYMYFVFATSHQCIHQLCEFAFVVVAVVINYMQVVIEKFTILICKVCGRRLLLLLPLRLLALQQDTSFLVLLLLNCFLSSCCRGAGSAAGSHISTLLKNLVHCSFEEKKQSIICNEKAEEQREK